MKYRVYKTGIAWGKWGSCVWWWNWLPKKFRYFGYSKDWYNGPIYSFGLWYINVGYKY
jgi:hypothetical protein